MNTVQKRIMIAVIAIIVGMLVYPPFQVVAKNGVVFNMGYGWIFDPPKRVHIAASVNVLMLLIQWVGILVVGGLAFFLAKSSPQDPPNFTYSHQNKRGPEGVGGWLLLLVVGMMVLGPLRGAVDIYLDIIMTENQYPKITSLEQWRIYKLAMRLIFLVVASISVYGGWGLAGGTEWSVVKRAKAILWITGPAVMLLIGVVLPIIFFGELNIVDAQFFGAFIASIISAVIWTMYLSKSKRVRNTYSANEK